MAFAMTSLLAEGNSGGLSLWFHYATYHKGINIDELLRCWITVGR
jgi:hypothetical protein